MHQGFKEVDVSFCPARYSHLGTEGLQGKLQLRTRSRYIQLCNSAMFFVSSMGSRKKVIFIVAGH